MKPVMQGLKANLSLVRPAPHPEASGGRLRLLDYVELTKPEVNILVVFTTAVGFYLGAQGAWKVLLLLHTLIGTALVAAGTATLNEFMERDADARMRRNDNRPLPAGRLAPRQAFWFGVALAAGGVFQLALFVNFLSSLLAFLTLSGYLFLYTPLKKKTTLCTLVGAFPGAMPPLIGWAGARGDLSLEAWILYAILFLWQFPHFLAIGWIYREDYARGGIRMLSVEDAQGRATFRQIVGCSLVLVPVSLSPALLGMAGSLYFFGALVLGLVFLQCGVWAAMSRSKTQARRLVHASVIYIPLVYGLLMWDKLA